MKERQIKRQRNAAPAEPFSGDLFYHNEGRLLVGLTKLVMNLDRERLHAHRRRISIPNKDTFAPLSIHLRHLSSIGGGGHRCELEPGWIRRGAICSAA
jgi:hypothetical protein